MSLEASRTHVVCFKKKRKSPPAHKTRLVRPCGPCDAPAPYGRLFKQSEKELILLAAGEHRNHGTFAAGKQTALGIGLQLGASVRDVKVAHR